MAGLGSEDEPILKRPQPGVTYVVNIAALSDNSEHEPIPCSIPCYSRAFREEHERFLIPPAPTRLGLELESIYRYKRQARLQNELLYQKFRSLHPTSLLTPSEHQSRDPGGPPDMSQPTSSTGGILISKRRINDEQSEICCPRPVTPPPAYDPTYMNRYVDDCVANLPVDYDNNLMDTT